MSNAEQVHLAKELTAIKLLLGLIVSNLPQECVEQISTTLQEMHNFLDDDPVTADAVQRAALFVASLPADKPQKNMRDIIKIVSGRKSDS